MSAPQSSHQLWAMPFLLASGIAIGLASGVLGDGVWDVVSWFALGIPIAVVCRFAFGSRNLDEKSNR